MEGRVKQTFAWVSRFSQEAARELRAEFHDFPADAFVSYQSEMNTWSVECDRADGPNVFKTFFTRASKYHAEHREDSTKIVFLGENHVDMSAVYGDDGGSRAGAAEEDLVDLTKTLVTQMWKPAAGNEALFVKYTPDILNRIAKLASFTVTVDKDNCMLEIKAESTTNLAMAYDCLQNLQNSMVVYHKPSKLDIPVIRGTEEDVQNTAILFGPVLKVDRRMKLLTTILTEYQDHALIVALPTMLVGFTATYALEIQDWVLPGPIAEYRKAVENSFGEFRPWAGFEYSSFGDQTKIPNTEDTLPKKGEYVQMVRGNHPKMPRVEQWRQDAVAQPLDAFAPDERLVTNPNLPPEITNPKTGVAAPESVADTGVVRGRYKVRSSRLTTDQNSSTGIAESGDDVVPKKVGTSVSADLPLGPFKYKQPTPLVVHSPIDVPAIPEKGPTSKPRETTEQKRSLPNPDAEEPAPKPAKGNSTKDNLRRPVVPVADPWGDLEAMDRGLSTGMFATSPHPVQSSQTSRSGISNVRLPGSALQPSQASVPIRGQAISSQSVGTGGRISNRGLPASAAPHASSTSSPWQGTAPRSRDRVGGGIQSSPASKVPSQQRASNQLVDLSIDPTSPRAAQTPGYTGGVLQPKATSTGTSTVATLDLDEDEEIRNREPQYFRMGPRPRGLVEAHQKGKQPQESEKEQSAYITSPLIQALQRSVATDEQNKAKSSERIQGKDEVKSREFHRTMGQKKPKSAHGGPSNKLLPKKEEKAKKEEARQAVINASWGGQPPAKVDSPKGESEVVRGKKAVRNVSPSRETDDSNPNTIREMQRTTVLIQSTLAGARCFTGQLSLVVDIGKILIHPKSVPAESLKTVQTVKDYRDFLTPRNDVKQPETAFIDKVTTSGNDCAFIVDLTLENGDNMFCPAAYGFAVLYEFLCKTANDEEVVLSMYEVSEEKAEDGTVKLSHAPYTLDHPSRSLGDVNYHMTSHIWDARLAVKATLPYEATKEQNEAAQSFVDSIIVPKGSKSVKLFAEVPTREFQIIDINMRRWTRFACEAPHDLASAGLSFEGREPKFYLQVMETQALHWMKRGDNLRQIYAYAESDKAMVEDSRLWYQVSIGSTAADKIMFENVGLPLGGEAEWNEGDIIDSGIAQSLVDIAKEVVSRIDGVGYHNRGPGAAFVAAGKGSVVTNFTRPVQTVGGAYVNDRTAW